jgi:beta-mannosidase
MEHHQRSPDGNMLITNTMAREMRIPRDFDTFCWVSQINQAMAIRTAVEHWRRLRPWCMGTIYWQINDLWPVASWSSIDYHGRWKVLHHFAARFYAPLMGSIAQEEGKVTAWGTSDLARAVELKGEVEVYTWAGKRIAREAIEASLGAGESRAIGSYPIADLLKGKAEAHEVCIFVRLGGEGVSHENFATLVPWKWVTLPKAKIVTKLRAGEDGIELAVKSAQVIPFFHAELTGLEGHFVGDWQVLRPGTEYRLRWKPHVERGGKMPTLGQARRMLGVMSLYDTYAHEGS